MNRILLCLMAFIFCASAYANSGSASAAPDSAKTALVKGPEIQFEQVAHDYGQIVQHANGDCEFKFTNIGTEPLVLEDVRASCGCTVPMWKREPVMPGETSLIQVRYDTSRIGYIGRSITVTSNAATARVVLRITGNVMPRPN